MGRYEMTLFGRRGEAIAKEVMEELGYKVEWYGGNKGFDHLINDKVTVDVKTARRSRQKHGGYEWQFSLQSNGSRYQEHVVLCICLESARTRSPLAIFVIPGVETAGLRKISITSKDPNSYAGKWAKYRSGWHVLNELLEVLPEFVDTDSLEIPF